MLRQTLARLGLWQTPLVAGGSVVVPVRGKKKMGKGGGGRKDASASSGTLDLEEIEKSLIPMEPYTPQEAVRRPDTEYEDVNPWRFIKHRKTLDPPRYVADEQALENSALGPDILPPGERYVNKLVLSMKGSCYATLRSYIMYAKFAAVCLEIEATTESGKLLTGVYTINRSPHVHGKHKDRYKRDIWNRKLILHNISGTTADVYLNYVQRNIPSGVTMAVTEQRLVEIPHEFLATFYNETNRAAMMTSSDTEEGGEESASEAPS